jgi:RNA polymerase sigma-70 factor (ECF subfamily)
MEHMGAKPSDDELALLVARGNVQAFEAIYDRYSSQAFGLAMRLTYHRRAAEEATQDAFLGLWRSAASFDQNRGTLSAWLMSMVRHRSIDWLRREARHDGSVEIDEGLIAGALATEHPYELAVEREQARLTRELVAGLPTEQQRVIELAYFEGMTQYEIAAEVGVPLGTVKGRQRLALTKMHRALVGPRGAASVLST